MTKRFLFALAISLIIAFPLNCGWADTDETSVPLVVNDFNPRSAMVITPRIVGGSKSEEGDWPWMAALVYSGMDNYNGQFCGGALIDDDWIITAAHCVADLDEGDLEVVLDSQNLLEDPGQRFSADLIIVHENYNPLTIDSDLALIHLTRTAAIKPLALVDQGDPKKLTAPMTEATVMGWGAIDKWGTTYPSELRQITIPITPPWTAMRAYGAQVFTINMLSAGLASGALDPCYGDSGGPMVVYDNSLGDWVLVGITSWGVGCATPRSPGVYTRVSRFSAWVDSAMVITRSWGLSQDLP